MTILSHMKFNENPVEDTVFRFFKEFSVAKTLRKSNCNKERGVSPIEVFKFIFSLVFSGKNLYRTFQLDSTLPFGKDVVYRFMNSMHINWHRFLSLLAARVISKLTPLTSKERVDVLIIDDSLYDRGRSRKVELLTRVRDHSDGRYHCGFRALTLGWSDGNSFIPVAFNLLSSHNGKTRIREANANIDKRSNGYKRREKAIMNTQHAATDLVAQAKAAGIPAEYVLFDSWFSYPKLILKMREMGYHTISVLKDMNRVYYLYNNRWMRLSEVYANLSNKCTVPGNIHIAAITVQIRDKNNTLHPFKIAFVREKGNKREWIAVGTTDVSLSQEEIVRIYGKRWAIEVFFKVCKSYLKLAKEFQGRSYDMMVAQTTIVFTRYIMLAYEHRSNTDMRSIGDLFYICCDELQDIQLSEALRLILDVLTMVLRDKLVLSERAIQECLDLFFNALPMYFRGKLAVA
jgi:hypothetical protein